MKVIPSILITETRATFGIDCGSCTVVLRLLSMKTISAYLVGLTLRLLTRDHDSTLINSDCQLLALTAGTMMYVSSANFTIWLPGVIGYRSPELTTYDGGPILKPWIMLAVIADIVDSSRLCTRNHVS